MADALERLGVDAYRALAEEFGVLERKDAPSLPADRLVRRFEERTLRTAAELAFEAFTERPWHAGQDGYSIYDTAHMALLPALLPRPSRKAIGPAEQGLSDDG